MNLLKESYAYQLWHKFNGLYQKSETRRIIYTTAWRSKNKMNDSYIIHFLSQEGAISAHWEKSLLCHILTFIVTIPGRILHSWYNAWQTTFEDSFFARLIFTIGEGTAFAEGWLIAALWVIPFDYWNNAYSLVGFAFLLMLLHFAAMRKEEFQLDIKDIGFYPLIFFAAVILAVPLSYKPELSTRFLAYHMSAALCVLLTVSAVQNIEDLKRLTAGGSVCVAASSVYAVIQRIQGVEVNKSYVDLRLNPDMPGRVYSYFDNPNTFAEVLIMLLPLVLALAICSKRNLSKMIAGGVFIVGTMALVMTYSRASWVGYALSVLVMLFLWRPSLIPGLFAACIVAIPFLPSAVWTRILTIVNFSDTSTSSRFPLYEAALRVIQRSPISGAGLGTDAVKKYIKDYVLYFGDAPFVHAHNFYLEIWLEVGLLGIISLLASLIWNIKQGVRATRHSPTSPAHIITYSAVASLLGVIICGMADFPWHYPRVMCIFWYVFAMALAGAKVCRHQAVIEHSLPSSTTSA